MQRNESIHTLIMFALVTLLAFFSAYAIKTIVSEKLYLDPAYAIPATPSRPEIILRREQRENTSLNQNADRGVPVERASECNIGSSQTNRTSGGLETISNFSPLMTLDRKIVLASTRNMNEVLMQARAIPCVMQGRTTGLRISRISPGSFYEKIGLQNDDVIMRINSRKLENPAGFLKLYQDLKNKQYISVDLYRHGRQQTLTYDIHCAHYLKNRGSFFS
jgi:type II secretory pathway component PulC